MDSRARLWTSVFIWTRPISFKISKMLIIPKFIPWRLTYFLISKVIHPIASLTSLLWSLIGFSISVYLQIYHKSLPPSVLLLSFCIMNNYNSIILVVQAKTLEAFLISLSHTSIYNQILSETSLKYIQNLTTFNHLHLHLHQNHHHLSPELLP